MFLRRVKLKYLAFEKEVKSINNYFNWSKDMKGNFNDLCDNFI